jgi:uncharacterized protein (TIGR00251 family)
VVKQAAAHDTDDRGVQSEIGVRLTPRASTNEIGGLRDGVLFVRVTAAPEGGRANEALCRLLAKRMRVGVRDVSVVRGLASRAKTVRVYGMSRADVMRALLPPTENR